MMMQPLHDSVNHHVNPSRCAWMLGGRLPRFGASLFLRWDAGQWWVYRKSRVRHIRGTISAPSKVTWRLESSRSGAVRTLGPTLSHISSLEVSACPAKSVDEEACCAGTASQVSINSCWTFSSGREFWGGRLWRFAWNSFPGSTSTCKQNNCKLCSSLAVRLVHLKHSRCCAVNSWSWRNELARQHSLR